MLCRPHLTALISAEEKAKYISVNCINFLLIFYRFLNGNLVFCLKLRWNSVTSYDVTSYDGCVNFCKVHVRSEQN